MVFFLFVLIRRISASDSLFLKIQRLNERATYFLLKPSLRNHLGEYGQGVFALIIKQSSNSGKSGRACVPGRSNSRKKSMRFSSRVFMTANSAISNTGRRFWGILGLGCICMQDRFGCLELRFPTQAGCPVLNEYLRTGGVWALV